MKRIGINTVIAEAIATIEPRHHNDKPLIRQFCNDLLDSYSRDGYRVAFNYNQPRAEARIQCGLRARL